MSSTRSPVEVVDATKRYVRLLGERAGGFIEFEFAIADPDVYVELILPAAAFEEFCRDNEVIRLPPRGASEGQGDFGWSLHDAARGLKGSE